MFVVLSFEMTALPLYSAEKSRVDVWGLPSPHFPRNKPQTDVQDHWGESLPCSCAEAKRVRIQEVLLDTNQRNVRRELLAAAGL